jgi:hypothetical protein
MNHNEIQQMMKEDKEIWADIPDYDGYYQVSTHGRVRSWKNAQHGFRRTPKILTQHICIWGYPYVGLSCGNKKSNKKVHRILAETFLPNPCNYPQIDHIDRNKTNNNISNLRWCTRSQNMTNRPNKGYHFSNTKNRWVVSWVENGTQKHTYLDTEEEAIMCRQWIINEYYNF